MGRGGLNEAGRAGVGTGGRTVNFGGERNAEGDMEWGERSFDEAQRIEKAAVVLGSREVLVWWGMSGDEVGIPLPFLVLVSFTWDGTGDAYADLTRSYNRQCRRQDFTSRN